MSESIQNFPTASMGCLTLDPDDVRRAFLQRAAALYDRPLAAAPDDLAGVDDTTASLLAFPWLDDAELVEALWALGQFRAGGDV